MGKLTIIASGKGGTGNSFVTAGLALSLAKRGKKVLIADNNAGMRGMDLLLGVSSVLMFDMGDVVKGNCSLKKAVYPCESADNVFLLPAVQSTEDMLCSDEWQSLMDTLKQEYDYILADCPNGVGESFRTTVLADSNAVVVVNAEPLSVRCGDIVRQKFCEYGCKDIRLVINRFHERNFWKLGVFDDLDEVIDKVGARLLGVVPQDNEYAFSLQRGQPLSSGTKAVYAFDRIAARMDGTDISLFIESFT